MGWIFGLTTCDVFGSGRRRFGTCLLSTSTRASFSERRATQCSAEVFGLEALGQSGYMEVAASTWPITEDVVADLG